MSEKSQTQIDTERADSMLNENRDDSFYKFPSKLREPWSSSQSEAYAPMSYMEFDSDKATGGGGGLSGIEIIWADQTETFIRASDMLENYDEDTNSYWSAVFAVSNNTFTKSISYDSTADLWDDVGTDQTEYRLRLITQGVDSEGATVNTPISMYGQYRESILCVNGESVTVLVKIS